MSAAVPDRSPSDRPGERDRVYPGQQDGPGAADPFLAAFHATRMAMVITDPKRPDNPVTFCNDAFCQLTGYTQSEIIGRNCRFLQGPETDADTVRQIRDAIGRAERIEVDLRNYSKEGEPFWNRLLLQPIRDSSGELAYYFGSQVDVTPEREWMEALPARAPVAGPRPLKGISAETSEQNLIELLDRALLELDARFLMLDETADLAYAAGEVLGRTLGLSRAGYGTIDLTAETVTIERDWNRPGVSSLAGTLQFRDYGRYIEDLKRGETVVLTDALEDPRTAATAERLVAIHARALINMPVTERGGLVALLYANHSQARTWTQEELAFVREVAQRTRMAVGRRRAEQELRALAASLEEQVAARTKELMIAEAALRQAHKMEAVGQLTGGLAHDFNNLLAGISGSLELMQARIAQGRAGEVGRFITAAQGAAARAAALTHRLLAFSRRQTLDPRPTDVARLISGMAELVRGTVGPSIALEVRGGAELWPALIDANQLESALLNLCINARDAMPDGGRIMIETANELLDHATARDCELEPGPYLSIRVTDTGIGMAPEVAARAFDPFFTTKPIGQGTGLGLSMIYGFARQSGGQVRIYSEEGRGTTMCLYLPRLIGDGNRPQEKPVLRPEPAATGQGETVLIVDDEATVRALITDVLAELNYKTIEAGDGAAALDIIRSGVRIDLLVTDVGLPGGLNGRQVADAGRELRPDLKVLFITGYAENAVIGRGRLEPGMHVLTKPFAMRDLGSRVSAIIDGL